MSSTAASVAFKQSKASVVPPAVVRSLYRSLLREVRVLDSKPLLKVLFPIPAKLQAVMGVDTPMYIPGGIQYKDCVRHIFKHTTAPSVELAFESLTRLRAHNETLAGLLPKLIKDRNELLVALRHVEPQRKEYWAKPVLTHVRSSEGDIVTNNSSSEKVGESTTKGGNSSSNCNTVVATPGKAIVNKRGLTVSVGLGLMAHPLSSAHTDRRVMLVVEKNAQVTTAVVLDMLYSYALSHGNPMFPEVFWGHDVYNGGYCHVDFTMPPTANVAVLHTLEPPNDENSTQYQSWLGWMKRSGNYTAGESPAHHHAMLCTPLIKGGVQEDGSVLPTLYYSKAEALGYLATLAMGQPRSTVRIYWGVMRWPTQQIQAELLHGHWMPVDLSPNFFGAYPFSSGSGSKMESEGEEICAPVAASDRTAAPPVITETFPTREDLETRRAGRIKMLGADVAVPQTFPPNQPMCRREALWDQILYSLGGEYRELIGVANPFSSKESLFPRTAIPSVELLPEGASLGPQPDDDDDDGID